MPPWTGAAVPRFFYFTLIPLYLLNLIIFETLVIAYQNAAINTSHYIIQMVKLSVFLMEVLTEEEMVIAQISLRKEKMKS